MKNALASLLLLLATPALAFEWSDLWRRPDQQAMQMLQGEQPTDAAEKFSDPRWRGISHYRAGDYERAREAFEGVDDQLYNQATAAARLGDYQAAIDGYKKLLERQPDHEDAKHNLQIAEQLAELPPPQQQPSDSNSEGDEDESDKQDGDNQDSSQPSEQQQQDPQQSDDGQEGESTEQDAASQPSTSESDGEPDPQSVAEHGQAAEQGEPEESESEDSEAGAKTDPEPVSETDQATEQWLRRIPDNPSLLLRSKIQLKHEQDYQDVRDMVNPW